MRLPRKSGANSAGIFGRRPTLRKRPRDSAYARACGVAGAASSAGQSKARRRPRQRELLPRASGFLAAAPPPPCTMPMRRSRFARTGPSGNVWRSCSPISFNSIIRCHGGYWSGAAAGRRCARRICQLSVRQPASALATSFTARRPCNLICAEQFQRLSRREWLGVSQRGKS